MTVNPPTPNHACEWGVSGLPSGSCRITTNTTVPKFGYQQSRVPFSPPWIPVCSSRVLAYDLCLVWFRSAGSTRSKSGRTGNHGAILRRLPGG
jgi:hypothetical protein